MVERHDTIALLANDESVIAQLRQRLVNKGNQFKTKELIIKANKLENLKKGNLNPPNPNKNKLNPQNENLSPKEKEGKTICSIQLFKY